MEISNLEIVAKFSQQKVAPGAAPLPTEELVPLTFSKLIGLMSYNSMLTPLNH